MTAAAQAQTQQRPWRLTLIAGVLGALGIFFGIAMVVNYSLSRSPGMTFC